MQPTSRPARRPSPFVAAVLSLIFPGLGQLYAGRAVRALVVATPAYLGLALTGGLLISHDTRQALLAGLFDPAALQLVLFLDALVAGYRIFAVVDAYRVAAAATRAAETADGASGDGAPTAGTSRAGSTGSAGSAGSAGPATTAPRSSRLTIPPALRPLSVAGLVAVIGVLLLGHVAVARYDRIAYDTISGITSGDATAGSDATSTPGSSSAAGASAGASAAGASPAAASPAAVATVPWNGKDRLNILLLGTDQRPGDTTFNTDTMIVTSIDPTTGQVAMFSVPRDTENVPLPPGSAAAAALGGVYPNRINSLWSYAQGNPGLFPGSSGTARGAAALKGALGTLLGVDIKYYVMVNFGGFEKVVDTLGGTIVDVQLPVSDYAFPARDDRGAVKLYIPPGIQYMTGAEALQYARARHQTNDFDRAQRQQRVITSVRQQTDLLSLLNPGTLDALSAELRSAIHTDFPASLLPGLVSLAQKADLGNLHSYVFTPPVYQTQCSPAECVVHYFIHPKPGVIQQAVRDAFTVDPALAKSRLKLASEGAAVWVLAGTKDVAAAKSLVDYLDYLGVGAVVPPVNGGSADKATYPGTVVTFYNGAETTMPETVRVLQKTFGVTIQTVSDPTMTADVVVTTGASTPKFQVPGQ